MAFESWMHGIYLFTAIFGAGVTVLDLLGMLGGGVGDGHGAGHGDGNHGAHADEATGHDHHDGGHHVPLLSILGYLRIFVYFSVGFGPAGLMSEATGAGSLESLAWAFSAGIAAALIGRAFFRFQQQDIDSSIQIEDLFLGSARVIVPISGGNMGKVRVQIGQSVTERYALAEDSQDSFPTDTEVQIVRVTDECVYVRRMEENLLSDKLTVTNEKTTKTQRHKENI
jgi:membrane protein implicated in regulation of membrane protease activity